MSEMGIERVIVCQENVYTRTGKGFDETKVINEEYAKVL